MQSRQIRRNRKRWERKTGRFLLLASRFSLLLIMTGLLLFHGGRDAEGWGLAGMLLSLTLVCWAAGCLFSGKVALMPTQGPLVFGLVLGMGLLQLSPFIGGLWAPEGIKGFWAALQIAELPSGSPLLALLPGFHSQALLFLLSAAVFQFLLVQLFGGPSGILLLSFAVLCCAALMSLLGLVQHFGGDGCCGCTRERRLLSPARSRIKIILRSCRNWASLRDWVAPVACFPPARGHRCGFLQANGVVHCWPRRLRALSSAFWGCSFPIRGQEFYAHLWA